MALTSGESFALGAAAGAIATYVWTKSERKTEMRKLRKELRKMEKMYKRHLVDSEVPKKALNFESMRTLYDAYGEPGVYAYLVERGIARDAVHGKFLIDNIFMPAYEEYKHKEAEAKPPLLSVA